MQKKSLIHISIPRPCHENWDEMQKHDKERHCAQCEKSVYSLVEYDEDEARMLVQQKVCVRVQTNSAGQIRLRTGFSRLLLLGGLFGCTSPVVEPLTGEPMVDEAIQRNGIDSIYASKAPSVDILLSTKPGEPVQLVIKGDVLVEPEKQRMGKVAMPRQGQVEGRDEGQSTHPIDSVKMGEVQGTLAGNKDIIEEMGEPVFERNCTNDTTKETLGSALEEACDEKSK